MNMTEALLNRIYEISDLRKAARVLAWDREVAMPRGGSADRIQQIATLRKLSHSLYASDEMGELIDTASSELNGNGNDSFEASLIRFLRRDYDKARRLPGEFVGRQATISNQAMAAWKDAHASNNYNLFKPWLAKIVELEAETAEHLGYSDEPYDALLDRYEPDARTADLRAIFEAAKGELISLYRAIAERGLAVDDRILRQPFEIARQKEFANYIANAIGYDFDRGHLATAVHPFSTSFSLNDVRITTRYKSEFLSPSIFATLHEAGHAIYVQNIHPALNRTPLAKETSAGLDESQSRLVENIIGRSRGFWRAHLEKLQAIFPGQLGEATLDEFYRAINKVQPGFIRVEADELTYNLHVNLRFELEQALLSGQLSVEDLPAAWNDKMESYLGIVPPGDSVGCLQDIHWTMVGFGYFPTYALGNLYAAQFYDAAAAQIPSFYDELESGEITSLMAWLRENIHQHGRKLTPAEVVKRTTAKPLSHKAFVRYATEKFTELYSL
jgi:carboxypeptidase Taq